MKIKVFTALGLALLGWPAFGQPAGNAPAQPASAASSAQQPAGQAGGQAQPPAQRSADGARGARRGRGGVADGGGGRGAAGGGLASPVVAADRHVTFRVSAPQATSVALTSDFQDETPLVKGNDGVWSLTVDPVAQDIYYYNFAVDGVRTIDPGNPQAKIGYYTSTLTSVLEVPGDGPAFYDVKDVPHGEIRTLIYKSQSNGVVRELNVYVPPGYDDSPGKRYPVLYLLHGNANDHHSWQRYGRANEILDNLLADKAIQPFLVVMPLGYGGAFINGDGTGIAGRGGRGAGGAAAPSAAAVAADGATPAAGGRGGRGAGGGGPDLYEQDILRDVIPMIDAKYRTIADRKSRAIFGFSMGGGQAGRIGLRNLNTFSYVGVMSAGLGGGPDAEPIASLKADVAKSNELIDLLWIGCGRDDFAFQGASTFSQTLKQVGIEHTFVESEGAHHWRVWRRYLRDFSPLLFKSATPATP